MNRIYVFLAKFCLILYPCVATDLVPVAPKVVLLDCLTGRVLFHKDSDSLHPPASLTKLVALHLAWKALEEGQVKADQIIPITDSTTKRALPPDSSMMFLEPGQIVTFKDLMLGVAVHSGNDAGLTMAVFLEGSQKAFVQRMNAEVRSLGYKHTVFYDAFGYNANNQTTAMEFARFCRFYLQNYPQALALHSMKTWAFPQKNHWPDHRKGPLRTIVQKNRNHLLWIYPEADGLKTGYIAESGYNLAATAKRNDQRLIVVVLGIEAPSSVVGTRLRAQAAKTLLDFGFDHYPLTHLPTPKLPDVDSWLTEQKRFSLIPAQKMNYPLNKKEISKLDYLINVPSEVIGPFAQNQTVGQLSWLLNGQIIAQVALHSAQLLQPANFFVQFYQSIGLFFRNFFKTPPVDLRVSNN